MANPLPHPALAWISVRHLQHTLARGEAAGVDVDALLQEAGLSRADIADPDASLPLATLETLLTVLARRHHDPLLGLHLAADLQPATFGALGYLLQSCTTLADAIEMVVRYNGLLSNIGSTSLHFAPGTVEVRWDCAAGGPALQRQITEYVLGAFAVIARLLLPGQAPPLQAVRFAHPRPAEAARLAEYSAFFQAPVYFEQPAAALLLPVGVLKCRLPHGDALVKELLERHALQLLQQRARVSSLSDRVRQLLLVMLNEGLPGKDAVAAQLGMSGRSLHRHLQEAGTSYRQLLDNVRLEQACARLRESDAALAEIAEPLGFASHQAFLRWFKHSTGKTPGEFRQQEQTQHDDREGA